jgi:mRNA interferase MazF
VAAVLKEAIRRGDLRWADLGSTRGSEQAGRRPVLVISDDVFNERSRTAIAMAITSQMPRAGFPLSYELVGLDLPKRSWVKTTQIRTLAVDRLGERLGRATDLQLLEVVEGLNEVIGG